MVKEAEGCWEGQSYSLPPGTWFPWAAREDSAAPAPRDSRLGTLCSRQLLLPPWPSSVPSSHPVTLLWGHPHCTHSRAFLTFTARRDVRCLGLYLVLEPLTPSTCPGLFQQSSCMVLGKPPSWAPRLLRAELLALRVGRADLPLWVELGPPGHSRATRQAATLLTLSLGCRRNQWTN